MAIKKKKVNKISSMKKGVRKISKVKSVKTKKPVVVKLTTKKHPKKLPKVAKKLEGFLKTGLKGFDDLFEKGYGIPLGSSVLVEGGPGSGKTLFCLAVVNELCKQGKKCLYMSFEEPEDRLIEHMGLFKWDTKEYIKRDLLRVKRFEAIDVSRSVEALLSAAKKELLIEIDPVLFPHDFKPDVVVIDSLTSIASAFSGHESRFRIYMEQLFRYLEKNNITTLLIREVATPTHLGGSYKEEGEAVSFLSDGIIILYSAMTKSGLRKTAIEILKMRGSSFKKEIVEMEIKSGKGIEIFPNRMITVKADGSGDIVKLT